MTDPYKAPDSNLEVDENLPSRPVLGIFMGLLIDLGGTILLAIIATVVYSFVLAAGGASESEIERTIGSTELTSLLGIVNTALGTLMSFLGGFFCAKIGRAKNYLYPGIMISIVVLLSVVSGWGVISNIPFVLLNLVSVAAALLGARLYLRAL